MVVFFAAADESKDECVCRQSTNSLELYHTNGARSVQILGDNHFAKQIAQK
jgi:hypothetical protein